MRAAKLIAPHTEKTMLTPPQLLPAGLPPPSPAPLSHTSTIADIWGTSGDDTLYADSNVRSPLLSGIGSTIHGGDGGDTIYGGAGADHLFGDSGNDKLYGGDNNDVLDGGIGNDTLWGDAGSDQLYGGADDDTLHGGADNDTLDGGTGNDTIFGDDGNDTIFGGDGNDTIIGGAGVDVMNGGAGPDTFVFNSAAEAPVPKPDPNNPFFWDQNKFDRIADFNPAEGDKIDLRGIVNEAGGRDHVTILADTPGALNGSGHDIVIEVWHDSQVAAAVWAHTPDVHHWSTDFSWDWLML
jgi:Ca2+-binding RTX toxin-like protein